MINDLIQSLLISADIKKLQELAYELYNTGLELAELKLAINQKKEGLKTKEALRFSEIKANKELKLTIPEIEAIIRMDTDIERTELLEVESSKERLSAQYEGAKIFTDITKTRVIMENKTENF